MKFAVKCVVSNLMSHSRTQRGVCIHGNHCSPLVWVVSSGTLRLPSESVERGTMSKDISDDRQRHTTHLKWMWTHHGISARCSGSMFHWCWRCFCGARWKQLSHSPLKPCPFYLDFWWLGRVVKQVEPWPVIWKCPFSVLSVGHVCIFLVWWLWLKTNSNVKSFHKHFRGKQLWPICLLAEG